MFQFENKRKSNWLFRMTGFVEFLLIVRQLWEFLKDRPTFQTPLNQICNCLQSLNNMKKWGVKNLCFRFLFANKVRKKGLFPYQIRSFEHFYKINNFTHIHSAIWKFDFKIKRGCQRQSNFQHIFDKRRHLNQFWGSFSFKMSASWNIKKKFSYKFWNIFE